MPDQINQQESPIIDDTEQLGFCAFFCYGLAIAVFAIDLLSKHWFSNNFVYGELRPVTGFLNLVLVHNYGAAFSFLSDAGGWQRWFFTGLSTAISLFILVWLYKLQSAQKLLRVGLSLVLGGALGNLADRLILGYVVDFIDVYYKGYHWPAFNVADSAITLGAVLILIDSFINHKREPSRG